MQNRAKPWSQKGWKLNWHSNTGYTLAFAGWKVFHWAHDAVVTLNQRQWRDSTSQQRRVPSGIGPVILVMILCKPFYLSFQSENIAVILVLHLLLKIDCPRPSSTGYFPHLIVLGGISMINDLRFFGRSLWMPTGVFSVRTVVRVWHGSSSRIQVWQTLYGPGLTSRWSRRPRCARSLPPWVRIRPR